jgi:hypothetical protein
MRGLGLVATQTLMFSLADIERSAALVHRRADGWASAGHHRLIQAGLAAHGG